MSRSITVGEPASQALFEEVADAWRSLGRSLLSPRRVEVIERHHGEPQVCGLSACAPGGNDVVAKRCSPAAVEPLLYEHVLAAIPGFAPRFHGVARGVEEARRWLFIEHVRGDEYVPDTTEHRSLAARWLGAVHSTTSSMPLSRLLPERGPTHYHSLLQRGHQAILKALSGSRIDANGRSRLTAAAERCASLERQWEVLEAPLEAIRPGLVHGDLVSKNIRIRRSDGGAEFIAFDWETAGWGVPVADLAVFSKEGRWRELPWVVDDRKVIGGSDGDLVQRIAMIGRIFRLIASVDWEGRGACSSWPHRSVRRIAWYDRKLSDCMRALSMEV